MKVFIATPTARNPVMEYFVSLQGLLDYVSEHGINGEKAEVVHKFGKSSMLPKGRADLVKYAIIQDATHILWIDDDMAFPANMLDYLFKHNEEIDIIGVAATTKNYNAPPRYCAVDINGSNFVLGDKTGLQEVALMGLGVCLMNIDVFKRTPLPWFELVFHDDIQDYIGEDYYLFNKLRRLHKQETGENLKLYIDADLSRHIYHMGIFPFGAHLFEKGTL